MIRSAVLRGFIRRHRWRLGGLVVLSLAGAGLGLAQPLLLQRMFDALTSASVPVSAVLILTAAVVAQALLAGVESYALACTAHDLILDLRTRVSKQVVSLPMAHVQRVPQGEFLSRMISDTAASASVLTTGVFKLLAAVITFVVAAGLMVAIDPTLFALSLVITVVATVLSTLMGRLVRTASAKTQAATATLTGSFERTLTALPLIRAYGVSQPQLDLVAVDAGNVRRHAILVARLGAYMQPVMTLATQALLIITLALGGVRVAEGSLSLGGLIAFMMYLMMMVGPVSQVGSTFVSIQTGLAAVDRIDEIVSASTEEDARAQHTPVGGSRGDGPLMSLKNVTFEYPQAAAGHGAQIGPLDITIREGEHVAVVGPSGSGKSTVFALVERFYEPSSGSVLLNSTLSHDVPLIEYRSHLAWVPQNSPPIGGSVRDNLDIEHRGLSDDVLLEALRDVGLFDGADADILDRPVSVSGSNLSGGERQRLGVARALLSHRRMLLLDEPTSSLDAVSAERLSVLLRERARDTTILMASHRLAEVRDFDKIIVMERGRIVDVGRHDELLDRCALYNALAKQQGVLA
ncbi:Multidrug resistance ABC transporter ATP-binding/permease protein BmrA [Microbacterium oxydans]|uniref:Multidrug resistance ABC transporter ATP-binding/permease protein BmrA n=1 Tax=Microbacterium oxydans TaxID=82380 RepID=A0A3S9WNB6_9MICO|nr:ABC transporter ATP-binding protein [Microbacterium oxydans]AZS41357.1 Multidrug resistance ABC transporter ATP-binding/permease protein BmrA [Microbacterium oxydans]